MGLRARSLRALVKARAFGMTQGAYTSKSRFLLARSARASE